MPTMKITIFITRAVHPNSLSFHHQCPTSKDKRDCEVRIQYYLLISSSFCYLLSLTPSCIHIHPSIRLFEATQLLQRTSRTPGTSQQDGKSFIFDAMFCRFRRHYCLHQSLLSRNQRTPVVKTARDQASFSSALITTPGCESLR